MNIQKTHPKSFILRMHGSSPLMKDLTNDSTPKYEGKPIYILQIAGGIESYVMVEVVYKEDYEDKRNPDELESKVESLEKEIQEYTFQLSNKDFEIESFNQYIKDLLDQVNTEPVNSKEDEGRKTKEYKYYIVVDEDKRLMTFSESVGQLYYCDDSRWLDDDPFLVKMVSKKEGLKQISDTIKFREENGYTIGKYYLMPVNIDPTITG